MRRDIAPKSITPTGGLDVPLPDIEQLRETMRNAPVYLDDHDERDAQTTRYRYALWEEKGEPKIIAEELVPEQEVLDRKGDRDYFTDHSDALQRYMNVTPLVSAMESGIGAAVQRLGFKAEKMVTDSRGSKLLVASLPSIDSYNQALTATGITTQLELLDEAEYSNRTIVGKMSQGTFAIFNESGMLLNAPALGLLPEEIHQALKRMALKALESDDNTAINRTATYINSCMLLVMQSELDDALDESKDEDERTAKLGDKLCRFFDESEEPADKGFAVARATMQRIADLSK